MTAKDKGQPSRSSSVQVRVVVNDENDNSPVFYPRVYFVTLPNVVRRNGPALVDVEASDADAGENAKIKFSIENQEEFSGARIDEESGQVFLERAVPADKVLRISATDAGGRRSRYEPALMSMLYLLEKRTNVNKKHSLARLALDREVPNSNPAASNFFAESLSAVVIIIEWKIIVSHLFSSLEFKYA